MACYFPITGYKSLSQKTENGKSVIWFDSKKAVHPYEVIKIPCGQCIGCRLDRSRDWALRCVHEASLYNNNCFITLTFDEEHMNKTGTLVDSDFQKFMKRLRAKYQGLDMINGKYPIRFFHVGEYGELNSRAHHHACIFNFDFLDKELWKVRDGVRLYRSESLEQLWPFGFSAIGDVTFQSAAYCARYCMKKVSGKNAKYHYQSVDTETGECFDIKPEYLTMSRRPGIAAEWFKKFSSDVYPKDFVTEQGKKIKPARYYDKVYEIMSPDNMKKIKIKRLTRAVKDKDNTYIRRKARAIVAQAKVKFLVRSMEK